MPTKILLCDDDAVVRSTLHHLVTSLGHEAALAASAADAVAELEGADFDLCVVDMHLPDSDGVSVIEAARRVRPPVPVLALTGQKAVQDALAALRAGAADFVPRPFHHGHFS